MEGLARVAAGRYRAFLKGSYNRLTDSLAAPVHVNVG